MLRLGEKDQGAIITDRSDNRAKSRNYHFYQLEVNRIPRLPGGMGQW